MRPGPVGRSVPASTSSASTSLDPTKARRIELILRQIDSLPTLPTVATRLLMLTASDDSAAKDVVELISSDQALTAKVLSMCRRSNRGVRNETLTIDKAVVLLGFTAIRNAVLSINVFEVFDRYRAGDVPAHPSARTPDADPTAEEHGGDLEEADPARFDRVNFWRHSLAVGIASELLCASAKGPSRVSPSEAFVGGLMHDVGKLALYYVLPKSFARVIELTDLNQGNIVELERRIVGLDHHTAGKRLAEQWQLPERIRDCIWLHGSAYESLPHLEHRWMIGLVSLADALVRRNHIGYSGNYTFTQEPEQLAVKLGIKAEVLTSITSRLHEELQRRAELLGLDDHPSRDLFLQSIQQANVALGRLNSVLERRTRAAVRQAQVLEAITQFNADVVQDRGVQDVLDAVVVSASRVFGEGFYAVLHQPIGTGADQQRPWLICQYDVEAQPIHSQWIEPPPMAPVLSELAPQQSVSMNLMGILPWIADYMVDATDLRQVHLLPLSCAMGTAAVLLHDQPNLAADRDLRALTTCWGTFVTGASRLEGSQRVSEELAQANCALAEVQERLLHSESMIRLGEMAAGAAHEMNNPLAVISGRSQMLLTMLRSGSKQRASAQIILDQSQRLSDLISLLRSFAEPPKAHRQPTEIGALLDETVKRVRQDLGNLATQKPISLQVKSRLPPVIIDAEQIGLAVRELLVNAVQSLPKTSVHVTARAEKLTHSLVIQVTDDGKGMDAYTLAHATDPFFSAKQAGRQVGMGLARANQLVGAHGGKLDLRSTPGIGTVATLTIPLDSTE